MFNFFRLQKDKHVVFAERSETPPAWFLLLDKQLEENDYWEVISFPGQRKMRKTK